jgi:Lon protease-like protein
MSEAFDKVRGVRELPLFPLPIVLFPGMPLPLHIFEPRYRRMLSDIQAGDSMFGLSYFDASEAEEGRDAPPVGHTGCVAELVDVQPAEDGRSNIITVGLIRYKVESYIDRGDPYLVGRVSYFEDEEEDEGLLRQEAREVSDVFMRIARAMRIINDERAGLPELPDTDPERLSFLVASAMEIDIQLKLEMLEMRSTSGRLNRVRELLSQAVTGYEERARVHKIAKHNGHGGKHPPIE